MGLFLDTLALFSNMCILSMIVKNINQNLGQNLFWVQDMLLAVSFESCMKCNAPRLSDQYLVSLEKYKKLYFGCETSEFLAEKGVDHFSVA